MDLISQGLTVVGLTCGYQGKPVLSGVDLTVPAGTALALLGPNGVGKTTLFRTVLGLLPAIAGEARVGERVLAECDRRERAKLVAYVPQTGNEPFGLRVLDVVLLGRTAWLGWRPSPSAADLDVARTCLDRLGVAELADRRFGELSGGQRQMVLIARALAQQPTVLMMDEPTASLDLGNEVTVLACIRDLAAEGLTVVFTSHRPEHAFVCADTAVLVQPDGTYATGPAAEVLTTQSLRSAYGVDVYVGSTAHEGYGEVALCTPLLPRARAAECSP